jgi:two-component system chemotaxis response regulator CheB
LNNKIKIAIAEDLDFFRSVFIDIFQDEKEFVIVGAYKSGFELLENIEKIQPDIILSDFHMENGTGLDILEGLREKNLVIPVIIISSYTKQESEAILNCLDKGAIDILEKPTEQSFKASFDLLRKSLLKKIRYIYNNTSKISFFSNKNIKDVDYILIGASTGGTKAIELILRSIKKLEKTSIFISQHMPPRYTKTFAQRLNEIGKNKVVEALDGEKVEMGKIYVAPGGFNMIFRDNKIKLSDGANYIVSPNIDVMFESFLPYSKRTCGIILTGMGSDGALGLKKLHEGGAITVAQDERTSVVYGMPKAAAELFIVDYILPLNLISDFIDSISK